MNTQQFFGYFLGKNQKILSLLGPSGTGKSFSADFMQEYLNYKIAKQITTRDPRPDDKHYRYMSKDEFIKLEQAGKILGLFAGDRKTLQGNGYGYLIDEVLDQIALDHKLILFPSAYELQKPDFKNQYGTTDKIGLGFKDTQTVLHRALQCNKVFTDKELQSRIIVAGDLTRIMEQYAEMGDGTFHLIYSDAVPDDLTLSKKRQLSQIISYIGDDPKEYQNNIEKYISR